MSGGKHPLNSVAVETVPLLTPGEVVTLCRVDPKTVTRWASTGRLGSLRTPGGHRRFRASEVHTLLDSLTTEAFNPVTGD